MIKMHLFWSTYVKLCVEAYVSYVLIPLPSVSNEDTIIVAILLQMAAGRIPQNGRRFPYSTALKKCINFNAVII